MIYIGLFLLGLALGSFVNALVWRLYEQSKKPGKKAKNLSVLHGRSMCVHCHHQLAWYDLLPVISWLSLKGKCRYCHKPISLQYPIVEALTATSLVISYWAWPFSLEGLASQLQFGFWLVCLTLLVALVVYDVRWMLLPDKLTRVLAVFALGFAAMGMTKYNGLDFLVTHALSVVVAGGLFYFLYLVSGGTWIGGGDGKLGVGLGLLLGSPQMSGLMIFVASCLGSIAAIPLIAKNKTVKQRLAFGPFLIIAAFFVRLFGQDLLSWYQAAFLP